MATVDVIALAIFSFLGLFGLVLALIPGLMDAAIRAVRSYRELRRELKGEPAKEPQPERAKAKQRQP